MHSNTKKEILRFDRPVPRYTSYPTAPHFKPGSDDDQYKTWLRGLPADAKLSLYFHLPFCPKLCWFCGCNTKITKRYEPLEDYLHLLIREIEMVGKFLTKNQKITNIHFGGGSPTILRAYDFALLMRRIHDVFNIAQNAEIAIEVDPRQMNEAKAAIYAKAGVTRASLGAPDFDEKVLKSVNRSQPFHVSYETVKILRDYGIKILTSI